jgi:LPS-assembly protein
VASMIAGHFSITYGRPRAGQELPPWHITADTITALGDADLYLAEGDVVVSRGNHVLRADKITYHRRSGVVSAVGSVELSVEGDVLTCDRGVFDLKDRTGYLLNGRLFLRTNHYYLRGKEIRKTGPATYVIKGCRITSCDGENPDWSITGSEVKVTVEGYGTVKHAAFYVRHIPLLYFPYIIFPAKRKRQTGFLPPSIGYSQRDGFDVEIPLFWAISEQTDATLYERYIEERGLKHGLEFRYITGADSKGAFLFDILSDRREEKNLFSEDEVKISPFPRTNKTRYWLRGRSDQMLPHSIGVKLDVDFVSDYDYLREFREPSLGPAYRVRLDEEFGRPLEEIQAPTRRSSLLITRHLQHASFQASSSYYQDPKRPEEDSTAQPLGSAALTLLPERINNLPFFFSLESEYGYIYRDVGLKGHRLALSPALTSPMWLVPYVELEPSVRYFVTYQWLEEYQGIEGQQTRDTYELGLRLSSTIERVFHLKQGKVRRLKHKFQPVLSYSYRPNQQEREISPWFEPVDTLDRQNLISLSLKNYLDARRDDERGGPTYSQIARFNLTQGFDLNEAREDKVPGERRKPFNPLELEASLTPYPALDLSASAQWDHYKRHIASSSVSLDLVVDRTANRQDRYTVDYEYTKDSSENLSFEVELNLLYGFSIGARGKRDLLIKYDIENSYWVDYQSQCWGIRLLYEDLEEDQRTMVIFRLRGVGEVGDF